MTNEADPPAPTEGGAAPALERAANDAALPPDSRATADLAALCAGLADALHVPGYGAGSPKKYNQTDKET